MVGDGIDGDDAAEKHDAIVQRKVLVAGGKD
jgi:hypothetical protein